MSLSRTHSLTQLSYIYRDRAIIIASNDFLSYAINILGTFRCVYTCCSIVVHKSFHLISTTYTQTLLFHYLSEVLLSPFFGHKEDGFHNFLAFQCTSTMLVFPLLHSVLMLLVLGFFYSYALQSFTLQLLTSLLILIEQSTFLASPEDRKEKSAFTK